MEMESWYILYCFTLKVFALSNSVTIYPQTTFVPSRAPILPKMPAFRFYPPAPRMYQQSYVTPSIYESSYTLDFFLTYYIFKLFYPLELAPILPKMPDFNHQTQECKKYG